MAAGFGLPRRVTGLTDRVGERGALDRLVEAVQLGQSQVLVRLLKFRAALVFGDVRLGLARSGGVGP